MPQLLQIQSLTYMHVCYGPCQDSLSELLCKLEKRHLPVLLPAKTASKAFFVSSFFIIYLVCVWSFETEPPNIAQTSLKLSTLLPRPPKWWNYKYHHIQLLNYLWCSSLVQWACLRSQGKTTESQGTRDHGNNHERQLGKKQCRAEVTKTIRAKGRNSGPWSQKDLSEATKY